MLRCITRTGVAGKFDTTVTPESTADLFDYFEDAIVCAFSSYGAIEAYCNVTLVGRATGAIELKRRGHTRKLSATQAEEVASTDEKVKRLVPDALGIPSPAGLKVWEGYKRLKAIRDAVTHFKRRDQARAAGDLEPTALLLLFETDPFAMPEWAMAVISHFEGPTPVRWMLNPAWKRPS